MREALLPLLLPPGCSVSVSPASGVPENDNCQDCPAALALVGGGPAVAVVG